MAYVPNPQDPTQPTTAQLAGNMAYELQALKGYIQSLVSSGTNFAYIGGFRNRLDNGNFIVAQRGNSFNVTHGNFTYTLDRWGVLGSGSGSSKVVVTSVSGETLISSAIQFAPDANCTGFSVNQPIESINVTDFVAGTPVTVSGLIGISATAVGLPTISLVTPTAQDNYTTTTPAAASQTMNTGTAPIQVNTYTFFNNTFILNQDCSKGLELQITYGNTVKSHTIQLTNIQLEKGAQYTSFEYRPYQVQDAICRRYYQTLFIQSFISANSAAGAVALGIQQTFPVVMRVSPTLTRTSQTLTNCTLGVSPSANTGTLVDSLNMTTAGAAAIATYTAVLEADI